jgi:hypothetical protein
VARAALCAGLAIVWAFALAAASAAAAPPVSVSSAGFPVIRLFLAEPVEAPPSGAAPAATENGAPGFQARWIADSTPIPLTAALVLDTSGSMAPVMEALRQAAAEAIGRLAPDDTLGLIAFSDDVRVLAGLDAGRAPLAQAVAGLRAEGGTALYDAVKAGVDLLASAAGRRALVLLSDGKDEGAAPDLPGSATRLEPLKRLLAESGIPLHAVALGAGADRATLGDLAAVSGGRLYSADGPGGLPRLFTQVFASLKSAASLSYVSPNLALDGAVREVEATLPGGARVRATYRAPVGGAVAWRFSESDGSGSQCRAAALSPQGAFAFTPAPGALIREDGRLLALLPQPLPRGADFERAAVLEDGTAFGFSGSAGRGFRLEGSGGAASLRLEPEAGGLPPGGEALPPGEPVAVSPSGGMRLWFRLPPGATRPLLAARNRQGGAALWEVSLCPYGACDRVSGAAIADSGAALVNLTGTLYRIAPDGKAAPARKETFFPAVSISGDGALAAAVIWRPGPKRALLLDADLRTVAELPLRSHSDGVPAVAAVSPDGRYFGARDDFQLQLMALRPGEPAVRRPRAFPMPRLRPAAACALTLALDNRGRALTGDGAAIFLHAGLLNAAP